MIDWVTCIFFFDSSCGAESQWESMRQGLGGKTLNHAHVSRIESHNTSYKYVKIIALQSHVHENKMSIHMKTVNK